MDSLLKKLVEDLEPGMEQAIRKEVAGLKLIIMRASGLLSDACALHQGIIDADKYMAAKEHFNDLLSIAIMGGVTFRSQEMSLN